MNTKNMEQKEMEKLVKKLVQGNNARIAYYRNNYVFYRIGVEGEKYLFPIYVGPESDIGNATLNGTEKASTLMKYIRQAIKEGTLTTE